MPPDALCLIVLVHKPSIFKCGVKCLSFQSLSTDFAKMWSQFFPRMGHFPPPEFGLGLLSGFGGEVDKEETKHKHKARKLHLRAHYWRPV